MASDDSLLRGREAYARRAWGDAYAGLSAADEQSPLGAEDLDRLGMAAYLTGRLEPAADAWERAYRVLLEAGEVARAVRCAYSLGRTLLLRGEYARGGGWLARAQRALEEASLDCVERGYLRVPVAIRTLEGGDPAAAYTVFCEITEIADRFGDADLMALGRLGQGRSLVASGDAARGVSMLDEAMVGVTAGEVSPIWAGIVYCAVILACRDILDVRRMQEWTVALSRWCATQQDLKPYQGQCLVHRSEIMQLRGEWADALEEIRRACEHLSDPPGDPVLGMALYQQAELLRLRGDLNGRRRPTGRPSPPGIRRSRGWRCCGSRRVGGRPRSQRSAAWSTRSSTPRTGAGAGGLCRDRARSRRRRRRPCGNRGAGADRRGVRLAVPAGGGRVRPRLSAAGRGRCAGGRGRAAAGRGGLAGAGRPVRGGAGADGHGEGVPGAGRPRHRGDGAGRRRSGLRAVGRRAGAGRSAGAGVDGTRHRGPWAG